MKKLAVGIMSGTSLDGIDVSLCEIEGFGKDVTIKELAFKTYDYETNLVSKIKRNMIPETSNVKDICELNFELAKVYASCVIDICNKQNIPVKTVDFIASHGQTMYHIPLGETSTLQLGDGSVIASITGVTTVSNFRSADMSVGGQGAPLVPFYDFIMYHNEEISRILCNIGGIANITFLPKKCTIEDVMAFDTGPGNMMIDHAMQTLYNMPYDSDGKIAASGEIISSLMNELVSIPYISKLPPKSTGRELFGNDFTDTLLKKYKAHKKQDIIATLTKYTAFTIYKSYLDAVLPIEKADEIIISGGGAHNKFLMETLQSLFEDVCVLKLEEIGYNSDSKEAQAFIALANETIHRNTSNVPNATGAKRHVIQGTISYAK